MKTALHKERLTMQEAPFLRSINIAQDAQHPERLMHFHPTAKCVGLIKKLLGEGAERSFFAVAPYGSGKSLACAYLLHLVENRSDQGTKKLLKTVADRLDSVDPQLSSFARNRSASRRSGLVVVLEGPLTNVADALHEATTSAMKRCKLGRQAKSIRQADLGKGGGIVRLTSLIAETAKTLKFDRVIILWDEFGRHLENLVSKGRASELSDVQVLAETASRISSIPVTLGVIMHQGFANYAAGLPQSLQSEWKKVEGRFLPVQYLDDSEQIYDLIGVIVKSRRRDQSSTTDWGLFSKKVKNSGLFAGFPSHKLPGLMESTWPIHPAVVYLLPRLAARTAQNERTMFGFLYSQTLIEVIGPDGLYEYFSPSMELDRNIGGTYRTWLETESATAKAREDIEVTLLRLASMLTLALSDQRRRLTPQMLEQVGSLVSTDPKKVRVAINQLLTRKLLLHRRHANQISLWHGTDVDLRGRVEAERTRLQADFRLVSFLSQEFPPPVWKPVVYNDDLAMRRYFSSIFIAASELETRFKELTVQGGISPDSDGEIWYVVPESDRDTKFALEAISAYDPDSRLILAVPKGLPKLTEPALELMALQRLLLDEELISDDPLAANEISQMIDDVHKHLSRLFDQFVLPNLNGPRWFHRRSKLKVWNFKTLRSELSRITLENFRETPRINSEMVTRKKPSAVIVNARKKLCLGILERYGQEKLGLEGEFADSAIFRSVLLATGLYFYDNELKKWRFAQPTEVHDQRLARVWGLFEDFFTKPSKAPKKIGELFHRLMKPPIGLRAGLFPVFVAAAIRAFPSTCSISRSDGVYLADLLPSDVESICREPENFRIFVPQLSNEKIAFLREVQRIFGSKSSLETDYHGLIRENHEAIQDWIYTLPHGALRSALVSRECQELQRVLRNREDPQRLLLIDLPGIGGKRLTNSERIGRIETCKAELDQLSTAFSMEAAKIIVRGFDDGIPKKHTNVRAAIDTWLSALPSTFVESIRSSDTRNFLRMLQVGFTTEAVATEKIAVQCTGKTFKHWADETIREFREALFQRISEIEAEGIENADGELESVKTHMLRCRINRLTSELAASVGDSEVQKHLDTISKSLRKQPGKKNGNHTRRLSHA